MASPLCHTSFSSRPPPAGEALSAPSLIDSGLQSGLDLVVGEPISAIRDSVNCDMKPSNKRMPVQHQVTSLQKRGGDCMHIISAFSEWRCTLFLGMEAHSLSRNGGALSFSEWRRTLFLGMEAHSLCRNGGALSFSE
eukprot:TRINITY_DN457_c0_g1_i1.p1 TRINITY_DN457_c0_g1~~TRINITY_DN457_c0_g1_i1.p1  ORF type:complete len:137 (+),score=15.20 TRINITY_DN457_c0_g1_i1:642-1052(+)